MNAINNIYKCSNCMHFRFDELDQPQCAIHCSMYSYRCPAFAPNSKDVELRAAEQLVEKRNHIVKILATVGVVVLAVAAVVLCVVGYNDSSAAVITSAAIVGAAMSLLAILFSLVYRLRRKRIECQLRFELSPKPITMRAVEAFLHAMGCKTDALEDDGFYFASRGQNYLLTFNQQQVSIMYIINTDTDIKELRDVAERMNLSKYGVKTYAYESDDEKYKFRIVCRSDFYAHNQAEFERYFHDYLCDLDYAKSAIWREIRDENERNKNQEGARVDFIKPEHHWLPCVVLPAVLKGDLRLEALTDEEWIRQMIQQRCADEAVKGEWDQFKIKRVDNYGDYKLIIYQFPEPKFAPESKFAALMLNISSLNEASYFTLDLSPEEGLWSYGGFDGKEHIALADAPNDELKDFVDWVFSSGKVMNSPTDADETTSKSKSSKNVN